MPDGDAIAGGFLSILFYGLLLAAIWWVVAGVWKTFEKACLPGWASLIPLYNLYVMCRMGGKSGWWLLLFCIPFVNLVALFLVLQGVAKNFGQTDLFGLGLMLLGFLFWPMLGYGNSRYIGPRIS